MKHVELAQGKAVIYSMIAGIIIGVINIAIFYMYRAGAPISVALPVTRIGVVVLAIIAGFVIFSETLSPTKMVGIALSFLSIFLMTR